MWGEEDRSKKREQAIFSRGVNWGAQPAPKVNRRRRLQSDAKLARDAVSRYWYGFKVSETRKEEGQERQYKGQDFKQKWTLTSRTGA